MKKNIFALPAVIVLLFCLILLLDFFLPSPLPSGSPLPCSAQIVDRHGRLLRLFTTQDGYWRLPARIDSKDSGTVIDQEFVRLLIACEDKRFWSHHGVDPLAIGRAFVQLVGHGRAVSGASTITMQTVRLLRPHSRTVLGKLFEMIQALRLERRLNKRQILETYLTLAPYGGNIEGVEAACRFYFQKNAARITPSQAALLISLPQSPERRRPDRQHEQAVAARNQMLVRLNESGLLTAEQAELGRKQPVPRKRSPSPFLAPHLSQRLHAAFPKKEKIQTSLDGRLQERIESLARQTQERLGEGERKTLAILVIDNQTRQVLAHVGAGKYGISFFDLTRTKRSPGSALKPFIYGLAFEQGFLHPETKILDRPAWFGSYGPDNFDGTYQGWISVREALLRSLNLPAVEVLERIGPQQFLARFAGFGLAADPNRPPGLSLALGGTAVSLQDLVALYAALADQGWHRPLSFLPEAASPGGIRMLSKAAAWQVDDILRTMPLATKDIRYKTGTSYGFRDAWAIGYTRRHTAGIWIGRPDWGYGKQTTGANSAVPVLLQVFAALPPEQNRSSAADSGRRVPAGVLLARHSQLPPNLQWFARTAELSSQAGRPRIAFPVDGSTMQLGRDKTLVLKAHGGTLPFHWIVNGLPLGNEQQEAIASCHPQGPGLTQITLVDSRGKRDRVSVWIEAEAAVPSSADRTALH